MNCLHKEVHLRKGIWGMKGPSDQRWIASSIEYQIIAKRRIEGRSSLKFQIPYQAGQQYQAKSQAIQTRLSPSQAQSYHRASQEVNMLKSFCTDENTCWIWWCHQCVFEAEAHPHPPYLSDFLMTDSASTAPCESQQDLHTTACWRFPAALRLDLCGLPSLRCACRRAPNLPPLCKPILLKECCLLMNVKAWPARIPQCICAWTVLCLVSTWDYSDSKRVSGGVQSNVCVKQ